MFKENCKEETTMTNKKFFVPTLAFITDAGLALYSYLICTDYKKFQEIAKITISDPDFQLELYKILLQTLTFTLIVFLLFHLVIYIMYFKEIKFAKKYVKFYLLLAILSLAISTVLSFNFYILIALASFAICFKNLKTAE